MGGGKNPRKSTQNHLTLEDIGVELWVSGGTPPSTTELSPFRRQPEGAREGITMPLSNIIAIIALIITTAMGLPDMIVSAITLYRTLRPGHGRHRK